MRKFVSCALLLGMLCGILSVGTSAFMVADGLDISYAAALESMVLLKNENDALPLTATDKIALFGEGQIERIVTPEEFIQVYGNRNFLDFFGEL